MIDIGKIPSWLLAASMALQASGCASSQMETTPEHPASPRAAEAPLPPVGEALSEPEEPSAPPPGGEAANASAAHSHDMAQPPPATGTGPADTPTRDGHQGHVPAANTPAHGAHNAPAPATGEQAERWTCPMHPEVIQPGPGKCPKCGMKLVPVTPKQ